MPEHVDAVQSVHAADPNAEEGASSADTTDATQTPECLYCLAYGYALGVLHAQPAGTSYGVRSAQDAADFAQAYREAFEHGTFTMEVAPAFGEWRTTGTVNP